MSTPDEILAAALALDPEARARIAWQLLDSVDPPVERTDEEWTAQIRRRAERVLRDGSSGVSWEETRAILERDRKR